jgi:hypothetical protein
MATKKDDKIAEGERYIDSREVAAWQEQWTVHCCKVTVRVELCSCKNNAARQDTASHDARIAR